MKIYSQIRKLFRIRRQDELQSWARENFNINDLDSLNDNEIAKEIRNFNIRYSMYMEADGDVRRVSLLISILALIGSIVAIAISLLK